MILADVKNNYNIYAGLSTEDKPANGVPKNSLFCELDTKDIYYFSGESWGLLGENASNNSDDAEDFFQIIEVVYQEGGEA